jgi:hypothetical protein
MGRRMNCLECKWCRKAKTKNGTLIFRASEAYFCMGGHGTYLAPIHENVECEKYEHGTPSVEIIDYHFQIGIPPYPPFAKSIKGRQITNPRTTTT